jgi:riboflavin synthase
MFTGIVTDVGEVVSVAAMGRGRRLRITCRYPADGIDPGASIACSGVCLTVVARGGEGGRSWFDVEASTETLARTTLGGWATGTRVNLERSLRIGDELGGHIVTGHVDGLAEIVTRVDEDNCARFGLRAPDALAKFIAEKGSIALDGTSLTVNAVEGARFDVMLIPHSLSVTTWGAAKAGDRVNLEVDLMARYAARLAETR